MMSLNILYSDYKSLCISKTLYIERLLCYLRNVYQHIVRFFYRAIRLSMFIHKFIHHQPLNHHCRCYLIFGDLSRATFSSRHSSSLTFEQSSL